MTDEVVRVTSHPYKLVIPRNGEFSLKTVIVIFGRAGHGKDTFANYLVKYLPKESVTTMSFADPIKDTTCLLLGIPKEVAYGTKAVKESYKVYGKTCRHWFQWFGTEIAKKLISDNIWIDRVEDRIRQSKTRYVMVTDGRFENERTFLKDKDENIKVINILIHRPDTSINLPNYGYFKYLWKFLALFSNNIKLLHASEYEVLKMQRLARRGEQIFDIIVKNDTTLEELQQKAFSTAQLIMK